MSRNKAVTYWLTQFESRVVVIDTRQVNNDTNLCSIRGSMDVVMMVDVPLSYVLFVLLLSCVLYKVTSKNLYDQQQEIVTQTPPTH